MANKKISELPSIVTLNNAVQFPLNDAGTTKKVTWGGLLGDVTAGAVTTIPSSYNITTDDGYETILVTSSSRQVIVGLPNLAANIGRIIRIKNITDGIVKITGDTIDGLTAQYLMSNNDYIYLIADSSEWKILGMRLKIETGMINQSDWTNQHLGLMNWTYDNLVGSFVIGETVTETGGNACTGIVIKDTGTVLTVYNVTNGGEVTDGNVLTGANSGATAASNEITGTSKNLDRNFYHGLGLNFNNYNIKLLISDTNSYPNSFFASDCGQGFNSYEVDTNKYFLQTCSAGIEFCPANGVVTRVDNENWYYNAIMEVNI